jgi:signal transduction histidine kinase
MGCYRPKSEFLLGAVVFLLGGLCCFGAPSERKNVLIIHSGGDDVLLYRRASQHLEQVLTANRSLYVEFFHEYLHDFKLPVDSTLLAESLQKKYFFAGTPDLIVTIGTTSLRLCINYGASHFSGVPVVFLLADDRVFPVQQWPPQITGVVTRVDFAGTVALALRLQPATHRIFFVAGTSGIERAYENVFKEQAGPLLSNYEVTYLDNLTFGELLDRLARLPEHSVVLFMTMLKDRTSTYDNRSPNIGTIAAVSNAPVYGWLITQIGTGIVGGRFFDVDRDAELAAAMARRILSREAVHTVPRQRGTSQTIVDWHQLKRWHIDERNLPRGTVVLFREPSAWIKFRWIILASLVVSCAELMLIVWLIRESRRRRSSELALKSLSGHLLNAQEEERARLARELHDGINQRISFIGISLSAMKSRIPSGDPTLRADLMRQQDLVTEVGKEIRRLSQDLHPPILKIFGIDRALKDYCEEFGASNAMDIQLTSDMGPDRLSQEAELCFYRIAQESLHNVAKHANANAVQVSLKKNGTECALTISDKGRGFNPDNQRDRGLGLLSMQERIEALQGTFTIWSKVNHGTIITARLPVHRNSPSRQSPSRRIRQCSNKTVDRAKDGLISGE